jgi:hypothetical protein
MPNNLSLVAPTQSAPVPETRAERRQLRRAGISLQVRVRSADFNDGEFEEVRMTQNASRKAIYFFTKLDCYYKGMCVRVTSPYDPQAGALNLEQIGEVARVHKREEGYGVAVALLPMQSGASTRPASAQAAESATPPSERRTAPRSPFIAPVDIEEMRTGSSIQARTSDLSPQGCYVETLNPLSVGTAVRLQIHRGGSILDVLANVSSRHVGAGMGLVFGEVTAAQRAIVESWLGDLGWPARALFESGLPPANEASSPDCTARLVQILLRKGVLSQTEAAEVLREYKG